MPLDTLERVMTRDEFYERLDAMYFEGPMPPATDIQAEASARRKHLSAYLEARLTGPAPDSYPKRQLSARILLSSESMLVITHVRFDDRGKFYENIEAVRCEAAACESQAAITAQLSVANVINEIKMGTKFCTKGEPPGEVEVFVVYGREYICSKRDMTTTKQNDLLSLPTF